MNAWMATAEQMVDTPAQSQAGLRAKAEGFQMLVDYFSESDNVEDRMAGSIAEDLLEGRSLA
jgi:hypothetical protein